VLQAFKIFAFLDLTASGTGTYCENTHHTRHNGKNGMTYALIFRDPYLPFIAPEKETT
jgi:hypothetical protein